MLELLSERDYDVEELLQLLAADPSTISKHLHLLRHERLVEVSRTGGVVTYSLHTASLPVLFAEARRVLGEQVAVD